MGWLRPSTAADATPRIQGQTFNLSTQGNDGRFPSHVAFVEQEGHDAMAGGAQELDDADRFSWHGNEDIKEGWWCQVGRRAAERDELNGECLKIWILS
jgi:hypothetical protein